MTYLNPQEGELSDAYTTFTVPSRKDILLARRRRRCAAGWTLLDSNELDQDAFTHWAVAPHGHRCAPGDHHFFCTYSCYGTYQQEEDIAVSKNTPTVASLP